MAENAPHHDDFPEGQAENIKPHNILRYPRPPERTVVDVVLVHGLSGLPHSAWTTEGKPHWPNDLLPVEIEYKPVRVLTYGYDAGCVKMAGSRREDSVHWHAQGLLNRLQEWRKQPPENPCPLIFVGHSLGGIIVAKVLQILRNDAAAGQGNKFQQFSDSIHAAFLLDETIHFGARSRPPDLFSAGSHSDPDHTFNNVTKLDMRHQNRRWVYTVGRGLLPVIQLCCTAVIGNYSRKSKVLSQLHTSNQAVNWQPAQAADHKMFWQCAQIVKHWPALAKALDLSRNCGSSIPKFLLDPSASMFAGTCIIYVASAVAFYDTNHNHKHQARFLGAGVLTGLAIAMLLHLRNTTLNVLITVMPTSITLSLLMSALTHERFEKAEIPEEQICRLIQRWAESRRSLKKNTAGYDIVEKEGFRNLISV